MPYQHECAKCFPAQLPGVAVLQVPPIAGQALFDAVKVDLPFGILPLEQPEPPFIALLRAGAQAPDDLAGIRQVKAPAHVVYALRHRRDLCLLIEFQLQGFQSIRPDLRKASFGTNPLNDLKASGIYF